MQALALLLLSIFFLAQLIYGKTRLAFMRVGSFGFLLLIISILAVFGFALYQSWQQYLLWSSNDFSKLFLPPYRDWSYFVFYVRTRFFNPYLISLAVGLMMMVVARQANKKYSHRFLEPIEPYLMGIGTFLVGYPLCFLYIPFVLLIGVVGSSILSLVDMPAGRRFSLYYLWLPVVLLTILISRWFMLLPWWKQLHI